MVVWPAREEFTEDFVPVQPRGTEIGVFVAKQKIQLSDIGIGIVERGLQKLQEAFKLLSVQRLEGLDELEILHLAGIVKVTVLQNRNFMEKIGKILLIFLGLKFGLNT